MIKVLKKLVNWSFYMDLFKVKFKVCVIHLFQHYISLVITLQNLIRFFRIRNWLMICQYSASQLLLILRGTAYFVCGTPSPDLKNTARHAIQLCGVRTLCGQYLPIILQSAFNKILYKKYVGTTVVTPILPICT